MMEEEHPVAITLGHDRTNLSISQLANAVLTQQVSCGIRLDGLDEGNREEVVVMVFSDPFAVLIQVPHPTSATVGIAQRVAEHCRRRAISPEMARAPGLALELDASRLTDVEPVAVTPEVGAEEEDAAQTHAPGTSAQPLPKRLLRLLLTMSGTLLSLGIVLIVE
jgi:hypothetical protein